MADRQATVQVDLVARLDQLRQQYQTVKKEIESDPIRVGFGASGSATGNPATFGNAAGSPFTGQAAGTRLDQTSVARNTGSALAMQNGSPGSLFGGITSMAGQPPSATQVLQNNATARAANPWAIPGASPEWNSGNRLPRDVSYENAAQYSAYSRANMPRGGFGAFPELPPPSSRYRSSPGERVAAGAPWPSGGGLARYAGGRTYADPDVIDAEWEPSAGGGGGGSPVSVNMPGARRSARGSQSPQGGSLWSTVGPLTAAYAFGSALSSASDAAVRFGAIGADVRGASASSGYRQEIERYEAKRGIFGITPFGLGAVGESGYDLGSAAGNYLRGNGFVTDATRFGRQSGLSEADAETFSLSTASFADRQIRGTTDRRRQIESARERDLAIARQNVYGNALFRNDPTDGLSGLNFTGQNRLDELNSSINQSANFDLRDYGTGIAGGYDEAENSRAFGRATLARDPVSALRARTVGRADARYRRGDPQTYQAERYAAEGEFASGVQLIRRDNIEAAGDIGRDAFASTLDHSGDTLGADRARIINQRDRDLRDVGGTGIALLDNWLGYNARRSAITGAAGVQMQGASIADQRRGVAASTAAYVAGRTLNDDPLGATLGGIAGQFGQATSGMTAGSTDWVRQATIATAQFAVAKQQFDNGTKLIGIGQKYGGRSIDQLLARDAVGAQAADITGQGLADANQLAFGGRPDLAEESRRQTSQRLNLLRQDFGYSFRGEAFDLDYRSTSNPRDSQDPSAVFAQIDRNQRDLYGGVLGSQPTSGAGIGGFDALIQQLTGGGKTTLSTLLDAIKSLTPEG